MSVAPLVRRVTVCRKVEAASGPLGLPYTARGIETTIRPPVGGAFPYAEQELWLFVQYADGQGTHPVRFELVRQRLETEDPVVAFDLPPIHMTRGRFFVLNRGYRLALVPFPEPGIYEFRIRCGNNAGCDEIRLEDTA
ncbi:hypothetical protein GobsT_41890 [Gemmata obscuriglobus]|uniref:Uncharacterized protein n=1 Tax=Gemmata obscuriglobus TaxID=114 RepID=A0A2Z3H9M4_9BACT|nr:hypothetical protein [Gemmata obscuriglobus]AWM37790.1 hypothetical protein C1280_12805 [Gemmata obscuriglobus]QEG29393.1 hypothetical protein GobsT_41890 [Gemmata obscuriglobus]VTS08459.1 unnamed protein product [Gemmata obscuriglobus UQM 2246]